MTHQVFNQSLALQDYNLFTTDKILSEAVQREGAGWAQKKLEGFGKRVGSAEVLQWGEQANRNPPVLKTHDRFGNRIDEVEFHPAWHQLMKLSVEFGMHSGPWSEPKEGAHVARAAMMFMMGQIEAGHTCPISMTYACVPALRKQPEIAQVWEPKIKSTSYDPRFVPSSQKAGVLLGMAMTEKQGGSDVRANTTTAKPIKAIEYALTGHKWFCSAPMNDAFLVLAQAPGGLTCFLLPRWTPDGQRNRFFIQRLKDKLGNRSNASSEVEFEEAWAQRVGEEGRGVPTIIEMVNHTRLDCTLGSAGLMRQALAQALHHSNYRSTFGKKLSDHPLMQNVLADLSLESEAATILALRLARSYDHPEENSFRRIATAIAKYWICKRTPVHVAEALECLGGNGFVEESLLPRLYRESPLNSIWEGSGNVICLDVLRAIRKEPESLEALLDEIQKGVGADKNFDHFANELKANIAALSKGADDTLEAGARRLVERLALALQGSLVVRFSTPSVSDAFCVSRLSGEWGRAFGTLPQKTDFLGIIHRS